MIAIVDPEYVDMLAADIAMLNIEIEQMKCSTGEQVREGHSDDVFRKSCKLLAEYIENQRDLADRVIGIARRYGAYCPETGSRVLVGTEWVIHSKFGQVTVIACVDAEPPAVAGGDSGQKPAASS